MQMYDFFGKKRSTFASALVGKKNLLYCKLFLPDIVWVSIPSLFERVAQAPAEKLCFAESCGSDSKYSE